LELGAGCGIVGIFLAKLGCHIVTTDQAIVLPTLDSNISLNVDRTDVDLQIKELSWGNDEQISSIMEKEKSFDFIFGSDIVFNVNMVDPLLETIHKMASRRTQIYICYEIRDPDAHTYFLNHVEGHGFELKEISSSKFHQDYDDDRVLLYHLTKSDEE
jgi:predicted nicotinamide N-methyase